MVMPALIAEPSMLSLHLGELVPPVLACAVYLVLYGRRAHTLRREERPVRRLRKACFVAGVLLMAIVQIPPLDGLADEVLVAHMIQHILIGDVAALLIVLGLTGPVLAPLLRLRATRPLRTLANPVTALALWAIDLYAWHLPLLYQLAIRHDLVHALEHACLLWFGMLLWLALIGPLPKPAWLKGWATLGYVIAVRFVGALLANALIWTQTVFYPVYRAGDAARGLNPLSDQNAAGAVMMVEQVLLTTALLTWLFLRFVDRDEQRQDLLDLAAGSGLPLSEERAARAAEAGAAPRLRDRLVSAMPEATMPEAAAPEATAPDGQGHAQR
jgi:putative membrane protein